MTMPSALRSNSLFWSLFCGSSVKFLWSIGQPGGLICQVDDDRYGVVIHAGFMLIQRKDGGHRTNNDFDY